MIDPKLHISWLHIHGLFEIRESYDKGVGETPNVANLNDKKTWFYGVYVHWCSYKSMCHDETWVNWMVLGGSYMKPLAWITIPIHSIWAKKRIMELPYNKGWWIWTEPLERLCFIVQELNSTMTPDTFPGTCQSGTVPGLFCNDHALCLAQQWCSACHDSTSGTVFQGCSEMRWMRIWTSWVFHGYFITSFAVGRGGYRWDVGAF